MVLANIVRAKILPPDRWNTLAIDRHMIEGDSVYESIRTLSNENPNIKRIDAKGYLYNFTYNFDIIQRAFTLFNNSFSIDYDGESPFYGSLQDIANRPFNIYFMNSL